MFLYNFYNMKIYFISTNLHYRLQRRKTSLFPSPHEYSTVNLTPRIVVLSRRRIHSNEPPNRQNRIIFCQKSPKLFGVEFSPILSKNQPNDFTLISFFVEPVNYLYTWCRSCIHAYYYDKYH